MMKNNNNKKIISISHNKSYYKKRNETKHYCVYCIDLIFIHTKVQ